MMAAQSQALPSQLGALRQSMPHQLSTSQTVGLCVLSLRPLAGSGTPLAEPELRPAMQCAQSVNG